MSDLPEIERVQAVEVRPGDTVILHVPLGTTAQQAREIVEHCKSAFPDNKVLIFTGGIELEIARPEQDAA